MTDRIDAEVGAEPTSARAGGTPEVTDVEPSDTAVFEGLTPPYSTIVADPPWQYTKVAGEQHTRMGGRGMAADRHYDTMTTADVCALPVANLAAPLAHLYVWVTNPKLRLGFDVMEAWGFTYQTTLTWVKVASDGAVLRGGLGWYFRGATEHVLFGTRGKAGIPAALREPNVVMAQRSRHSAKPAEFFDLVQRVSPGPYAELFARSQRFGWDAWGDEVAGPSPSQEALL